MFKRNVSGVFLLCLLVCTLNLVLNVQSVQPEVNELLLYTDKDSYVLGENVTIIVENVCNETVNWAGRCPVPWDIYTYPQNRCVFEAIGCYCVFELPSGENITYVWNQSDQFTVSPVEPGNYVVKDNQGWGASTYFKITILGDIDGDCHVFLYDLTIIGAAWNSTPGDENWCADADIDGDLHVYLYDLTIIGSHWDEHHP